MAIEQFEPRVEVTVDKVRAIYAKANARISRVLKTGITDARREQLVIIQRQVTAILDEINNAARPVIEAETLFHYRAGAKLAFDAIKNKGGFGLLQIDKEAIDASLDDIFLRFGDGMDSVQRSAARVFDEARKIRLQGLFADGRITAATRQRISGRIQELLKDETLGMTDRGGHTWTIERYAEMLTRTKMVEATNRGLTNRMLNQGFDLVQVSDHVGECDQCHPWEGKVLSITGNTAAYAKVQDAYTGGLFHPNCKHRLLPYHPDIAGAR
jgi:hypothetical protein